MKLIFCPTCEDIVRLYQKWNRTCKCGKSGGSYTDNINAVITGEAIPIGFINRSFVNAIINQPKEGSGEQFIAFTIPVICPTVTKIQGPIA